MRWKDIDPKSHFWTIPAGFVKNAHGHRVYLNETARRVLDDVPPDDGVLWVFPKSRMGDYKHVGRRLPQSTREYHRGVKARGRARDRADVRGHDLRRTAASLMASGGVPRFLISRILNHSQDRDITASTIGTAYDAEKRAAMEFWARQLTCVLENKPLSNAGRFEHAFVAGGSRWPPTRSWPKRQRRAH